MRILIRSVCGLLGLVLGMSVRFYHSRYTGGWVGPLVGLLAGLLIGRVVARLYHHEQDRRDHA